MPPRWLLTIFVQVQPLLSVSVSGSQLSHLEMTGSTWTKQSVWGVFTAWRELGAEAVLTRTCKGSCRGATSVFPLQSDCVTVEAQTKGGAAGALPKGNYSCY